MRVSSVFPNATLRSGSLNGLLKSTHVARATPTSSSIDLDISPASSVTYSNLPSIFSYPFDRPPYPPLR
jgi:hypothetical protein